jgi:hypothetical protein
VLIISFVVLKFVSEPVMSLSVKPNKNNKETTMTPAIKPKNKNIKETTRAPLVLVDSRLFLLVRVDDSMGNKLTMCCQLPRYVHVA